MISADKAIWNDPKNIERIYRNPEHISCFLLHTQKNRNIGYEVIIKST
jgi:hypothetical protein